MSKIDLVIIGSEILNGFTLDTNTQFIATELFNLGFRLSRTHSLRDDTREVLSKLKEISKDSDLIITTGGLGPTDDDLTVDILCKLTNAQPIHDKYSKRRAQVIFDKRMKDIEKDNSTDPTNHDQKRMNWERILRQTRIPEKAIALKNKTGIAPGIWLQEIPLLALPGFPIEIKAIWPAALEMIQSLDLKKSHTTIIPVWGWGESTIFSLLDFPEEIEVGVHALEFGCRLFLSSKNEDSLRSFSGKIRKHFAGCAVENPLLEILKIFDEKKLTLGTVESCTGGLLAKLITDEPGVSKIFKGSVICYHNEIKESLLGVSEEILEKHGAVSMEAAFALAQGGLKKLNSDIILVTTGIAGPGGGTPDKPVGTVYAGFADKKEGKAWIQKYFFPFGRERFRQAISYILFLNIYQKYIFFDNTEVWQEKGLGKEFQAYTLS